jgi:hypothetical protein
LGGEGRLDEETKNKIKGFKLSIDNSIINKLKDTINSKTNKANIAQMKKDVNKITKKRILNSVRLNKKNTTKKSIDISLDKPHKKTKKIDSTTNGGGGGGRNKKTRKHKSLFKFW